MPKPLPFLKIRITDEITNQDIIDIKGNSRTIKEALKIMDLKFK